MRKATRIGGNEIKEKKESKTPPPPQDDWAGAHKLTTGKMTVTLRNLRSVVSILDVISH